MTMPDFETIKTLGIALSSLKTIADIANTITNTQLRTELNGKIGDLLSAIFNARQQSLEMQEKYEAALKEVKELRATLDRKESEVFLHGVWWLTSSFLDERRCETEGKEVYSTVYDGPYCPLRKERDQKFVHLKPNGQTAPGGRMVYDCEVHNTDYEVPPMST